jgi:serine/threonine-protein kinase
MTLPSGKRLGPYELLAPLGAGGMGEVYRARDHRLDRDVAVKVLPEEMAARPGALDRFEREAKAVAALSHPNILAIYDIGNEEGLWFAVTELLEGATLRERLAASGLGIPKTLALAVQIAHGLAAAHDRGIVHRDLKPENIFLIDGGQVKILDFGLAKWSEPTGEGADAAALPTVTHHTSPGTILGTAGYMSPEQARGQPTDHRSDIFSFGAVLYEMLYGTRAFHGDSAADILSAILREIPAPPEDSSISVPPLLESVVARCLEKMPGDRFQSARDLAFALEAISIDGTTTDLPFETGTQTVTGRSETVPSVAVLPFRDLSPGRDQDYFCEGMAEEILNALTKIEGLQVASRSSAFRFADQSRDTREIGAALKVGTLLEGSVKTAGNRLRVTAQLINVEDGFHIWSERFDRQMEDVFDVQDEISQRIAELLRGELIGQSPAPKKRGTDNLEAYHLYLKGQHNWYRREKDSLRKAADFFDRATQADPGYVAAYTGLANAYSSLGYYGLRPDRARAKARAAIDRASALDADLPEVHAARGLMRHWLEWDLPGSERSFRKCLELEPDHVLAHCWYGFRLAWSGSFQEALSTVRRAAKLDPLSPYVNTVVGHCLYISGRFDEAIEPCRRALEMEPDFLFTHWVLGSAYICDSRPEDAVPVLERAATLSGRAAYYLAILAHALGAAGRRAEAEEILRELSRRAERDYVSPTSIAWAYAGLGEQESALDYLEKGTEARCPLALQLVNPLLESLRPEPRFQRLWKRLDLP